MQVWPTRALQKREWYVLCCVQGASTVGALQRQPSSLRSARVREKERERERSAEPLQPTRPRAPKLREPPARNDRRPGASLYPAKGEREKEEEGKPGQAACVRASVGFPRGHESPGSRCRCVRSTDAGVHVNRARRSTSVGARPSCVGVLVCVRRRAHTTLLAASAGAPYTRVR